MKLKVATQTGNLPRLVSGDVDVNELEIVGGQLCPAYAVTISLNISFESLVLSAGRKRCDND